MTLDAAWAGGQNHPYMHTPQDDATAIEPQGLLWGAQAAIAAAWLLANDGH